MALYSLALNTTVTTNNAACWGFLAQSDENPRIHELHIQLGIATTSHYGFGRAATAGTQTSAVSVLPDNAGDATTGVSTCAASWSAAPTVPTQYLRRASLNGVIGNGVIMTFPYGIGVATSAEMVLWNLATNANTMNVTVVSQE